MILQTKSMQNRYTTGELKSVDHTEYLKSTPWNMQNCFCLWQGGEGNTQHVSVIKFSRGYFYGNTYAHDR